jgi:hypothetical protein
MTIEIPRWLLLVVCYGGGGLLLLTLAAGLAFACATWMTRCAKSRHIFWSWAFFHTTVKQRRRAEDWTDHQFQAICREIRKENPERHARLSRMFAEDAASPPP